MQEARGKPRWGALGRVTADEGKAEAQIRPFVCFVEPKRMHWENCFSKSVTRQSNPSIWTGRTSLRTLRKNKSWQWRRDRRQLLLFNYFVSVGLAQCHLRGVQFVGGQRRWKQWEHLSCTGYSTLAINQPSMRGASCNLKRCDKISQTTAAVSLHIWRVVIACQVSGQCDSTEKQRWWPAMKTINNALDGN